MNVVGQGFIGQVVYAHLTEAQFQAQAGAGWILADGRNVAGSAYASITGESTVDDLRGVFVRGKNNGRSDGKQNTYADRALGFYEYDNTGNHIHEWSFKIVYTPGTNIAQRTYAAQGASQEIVSANIANPATGRYHIVVADDNAGGTMPVGSTTGNIMYTSHPMSGASPATVDPTASQDGETTVRNVTLNAFVRIN